MGSMTHSRAYPLYVLNQTSQHLDFSHFAQIHRFFERLFYAQNFT